MSLANRIKENPKLKKIAHWMLLPTGKASPRLWVRLFVNPFIHKRGKGSTLSRKARVDVVPFNQFIIGKNSTIEDFCTVNNGVGNIEIGNNSLVGIGDVLIGPVKIGNNVIFAQHVVLSGLNHTYTDISIPIKDQKVTTAQITVEDNCWVGANSVLTAGITLGKHCVVAGGSVVTKDVPPYSIVAGNPARILKKYNPETNLWEKNTL